MKALTKTASFKQGSYVSCHLTYAGNLVGHIMFDNVSECTVKVLGIIKVVKSYLHDDDDGSKVWLVDEIIYACYSLSSWNFGCIIDVPAEDLIKASSDKKEEALSLLIEKEAISILDIPFFAQNIFVPFSYRP
jgi:hypothetical protein